jgi:hypothetical protein
MNSQSPLPDEVMPVGVAPADRRARQRWPRWKIMLAYVALFGVALGSVWTIDGHVLSTTQPAPTTMSVNR